MMKSRLHFIFMSKQPSLSHLSMDANFGRSLDSSGSTDNNKLK